MRETEPFELFLQRLPVPIPNITRAIAYEAGVPPSMTFALMVNAVATALRGRHALRLPDGVIEPIHRIDLVLGEPECGKNSVMRLTHGPIKEFDKKVDTIKTLEGSPAISRPLLLESDKPAELIEVIAGKAWSTTVALVDGGTLLASPYFRRDMQRTCALWDFEGRYSQRDTQGKLRAAIDPAVNFLGMPQLGPWQGYLEKYGPNAFHGGLLQRCSITFPTPCLPDDQEIDLAWVDAYQRLLTRLLGDAEAYAMEGKVEHAPISLSASATRIYGNLNEGQKRARRAGAPGPWRRLQKSLRTSLLLEILMTCTLPGTESGPYGDAGNGLTKPSHAAVPGASSGIAKDVPGIAAPRTGGSSVRAAGVTASGGYMDIEAALDKVASVLSRKAVGTANGEPPPVADLQVSKRALEAAMRYTSWQLSQPGFRAMQEMTRAKPPPFRAEPTRTLTSAERRAIQLQADQVEVIRCVELCVDRARSANFASLVGRPELRKSFEYILQQELADRVGIYAVRFRRALAYLIDEGYLAREGSGRRARLCRTGRSFEYPKLAMLHDSPL